MADIFNLTDTWNNAGTAFTAIKMNVTDTASLVTSNLIDLQVAASSKFSVSKAGAAFASAGTAALPGVAVGVADTGMYESGAQLAFTRAGVLAAYFATNGYFILANNGIDAPNVRIGGTGDLALTRDAARVLAVRDPSAPTNAMTVNVYNTFTDASNYERNALTWSSNVCYQRNQNAGTGSARLYVPVTGTTTVGSLPAAATAGAGARSMVTDALAPTFAATVAAGGAVVVPVYSDGTAWRVG